MKLEYNILWIDNDLQSYIDNNSVKSIEDFLLDRGFEPNIEKVFDEADLDQYISRHNYDLILSDYNLENTTGDVLIEDIRVKRQLDTEILFYTAQGSYKNDPVVRERLAFIERLTFQVGRDTLLDKIEKVIELTLKKLLELNATRGLITAATSDLDVEIESIVMLLIGKYNINVEVLNGYITDKVVTPMGKRLETFWEKYDNFQNYFHKIDAVKKWEILRDLLQPLKAEAPVKAFLEKNKTYQDEVIEVRNKFSHAQAENIDGITVLKGQLGKEGFQFDKDACIQIRKNLITHRGSFKNLRQIINALP